MDPITLFIHNFAPLQPENIGTVPRYVTNLVANINLLSPKRTRLPRNEIPSSVVACGSPPQYHKTQNNVLKLQIHSLFAREQEKAGCDTRQAAAASKSRSRPYPPSPRASSIQCLSRTMVTCREKKYLTASCHLFSSSTDLDHQAVGR